MSAKRDYYEVLGVSKTSSIDEVKNQYRKLAQRLQNILKKFLRHMLFFQILKKSKSMINMVMLVLMADTLLMIYFKEHVEILVIFLALEADLNPFLNQSLIVGEDLVLVNNVVLIFSMKLQ